MKITDIRPEKRHLRTEIIEGLSRRQKTLPPKLLYDERGSKLFEEICHTNEYYVTRVETRILEKHADEICDRIGPEAVLIEMGSGSSEKGRILLRKLRSPAAYVPVDIAEDALRDASRKLHAEYPGLRLLPVCEDFSQASPRSLLGDPELRALLGARSSLQEELSPQAFRRRVNEGSDPRAPRSVVAFIPGSTIGNFEPDQATRLLEAYGGALGEQGAFLIGIDLVKDASIMQKAYDDDQGITAAFNLNVLTRMNREFSGNFDLTKFEHVARFSFWESRIEMHLQSLVEQNVTVAGETFHFRPGETILTEESYKYTREAFARLARNAGWQVTATWTDPDEYFAVLLLRQRRLATAPEPAEPAERAA